MRVAVIGTGYVGLVVGAGLADSGNDVICADIDADKIDRLRRGEILGRVGCGRPLQFGGGG